MGENIQKLIYGDTNNYLVRLLNINESQTKTSGNHSTNQRSGIILYY